MSETSAPATTLRSADPAPRLGLRGVLMLLTLCGATFMTAVDFSIVAVALPAIGRSLGFGSPASLQWVATACVLPTAALLPLFGRVADLLCRRRLFRWGAALFVPLSLLAGLAVSPAMLIVARVGQGIAAAMIGATAIALLTTVFPEGVQRTKALGVNGAMLSMGFVAGTIGGGVITSGLSWRWTMLILVIVGTAVLIGAFTVLPPTPSLVSSGLDVPGAVLASSGLFALVYGISTGSDNGWGALTTVGALVAAAALLAGFFLVEARHPAPLIPLSLLGRRTVTWSFVAELTSFGMCAAVTILLSLYMQEVLGYSPLASGFGFLAEGIAAAVAGSVAARVITSLGTTRGALIGLTVQAVASAAMIWLPASGALVPLLVTSGAMGFGHVLAVVSLITKLTSSATEEEKGVAGSLAQMPQFLGAVGIAALIAVASARSRALAPQTSAPLALLGGLHAATLAAAGVLVVGIVTTGIFLRSPRRTATA
jgi:MFS family permease